MSLIGLTYFSCFMLMLFVSFKYSPNIFSPFKVLFFNITIFWGDIFWIDFSILVYLYFLYVLLISLVVLFYEIKFKSTFIKGKIIFINKRIIFGRLWMLTLIPILFQIVMIFEMGGISAYVHSINLRVVMWQGYGIYLFFIRSILIINLIYFYFLIRSININKRSFLFFLLHSLIFISISLLSGSRSTLLVNFILMLIMYNLIIKDVNILKIVSIGFAALLVAFVLGVARYGYSYEDGELSTGLSNSNIDKKFEFANFSYGLFPIDVISNKDILVDYYYGSTYFTIFSNFIPRFLWSNKPDTSGVIFTNTYYNVHDGYSNYSTGFIVDGILNFGFIFGPILGFLIIVLIYYSFFKYFNNFVSFTSNFNLITNDLFYVVILFLLPTFLHGEFTTVFYSIFVFKIILIYLIYKFCVPINSIFRIY
ncbi:O-antigen polymerase [Algoriphagus sp. C2-6-M1]|uniref:O-antigen polymerase n=1 Tax=Algoriphagus persicinus TaxID=3108754 RepID=UPI002B3DF0E9|nr:O-antigen polymerase [Algoriphagus sp. C2-6-M1]MEB2781268.1 O-antigen polymerase [Algoriphagus sp. C2-6-M1]